MLFVNKQKHGDPKRPSYENLFNMEDEVDAHLATYLCSIFVEKMAQVEKFEKRVAFERRLVETFDTLFLQVNKHSIWDLILFICLDYYEILCGEY